MIYPNERKIDRLFKVTGAHSKRPTGVFFLAKAKRDRAEWIAWLQFGRSKECHYGSDSLRYSKMRKALHDIKIADTKLKNVSAIFSNSPAFLSEAHLKRMPAQEVFLTGIVTGAALDDDLEPATSAPRRRLGGEVGA